MNRMRFLIHHLCLAALCQAAVVSAIGQTGFGRGAVKAFNLESPPPPPQVEDRSAGIIQGAASGAARHARALANDVLRAEGGRIQLFSVSRLSDDDIKNPFEIRVHVIVDVRETVIEIGGIVEGRDGQGNSTIIKVMPPMVREGASADGPEAAGENGKINAKESTSSKGSAKKQNEGIRRVCSVGDEIEGFRVQAILRESVILEHATKIMEIPRGQPVVVCVPLSVR